MKICRPQFSLAPGGTARAVRARLPALAVTLTCALALLTPVRVKAALSDTEITDLFSQAKDFFRQANDAVATDPEAARELYRKAVLRFERIAEEGRIRNGQLYYNIGNTYFRMEDIGRAILNYRRAQQYSPNDVNLQRNLQYARSKRLDQIEEKQETRVLKTLFFWHYDLSTRARALIFAVSFAGLWVAAALRTLWRRPGTGWLLALCALAALLASGSLVAEAVIRSQIRPGVVLAREAVARKGDSETYEQSFTQPLHAGTEFTLREQRGEWFHIELADGRSCWIPAKSAELVR